MLISLIDFVDFAQRSGSPRLTKVRQVKDRGEYDPRCDFWRAFREAVKELHAAGDPDRKRLDQLLEELTDPKKHGPYAEAIAGYKRFLGRKNPLWFRPRSTRWRAAGVSVRVNPEIGLQLSGVRHHPQLYPTNEPLAKKRLNAIPLLMQQAYGDEENGTCFGVLDVQRGKLHATASPDPKLLPLLIGEAAGFAAMWEQL
ncbi:MAG: hypothetical protein AAF533_11710 [Acidobacteriota bacterium]